MEGFKELEQKFFQVEIYEREINNTNNWDKKKELQDKLKAFIKPLLIEAKKIIDQKLEKGIIDFFEKYEISQEMIEFTEALGFYLAKKDLSTGQIRNMFGEIKSIQLQYNTNRIKLLKPKLEYVAKKNESDGMKLFRDVMRPTLDFICYKGEQEYNIFINFFESVLAYHKAFGGK